MICPNCGAEYRQGFTKCADCEVDLVAGPAGGEQALAAFLADERRPRFEAGKAGDPNEDPFCSFWKGTDARVCAELCTVLDEAGIPHKTVHRQDHLFNFANQSPYELGVPASMYERAELAVKEAFGTDDDEARMEGHLLLKENSKVISDLGTFSPWLRLAKEYVRSGFGDVREPTESNEMGSDFTEEQKRGLTEPNAPFPEDATVEVWSGEDEATKEIIEMSLRENDVLNRSKEEEGRHKLMVLLEDEGRAKEIVREIVEGTPLE